MSVRFSSAGAACVGWASFGVWPPAPRRKGQNTAAGRGRSATKVPYMHSRSRIPRFRRDYDGLAERIRIASSIKFCSIFSLRMSRYIHEVRFAIAKRLCGIGDQRVRFR